MLLNTTIFACQRAETAVRICATGYQAMPWSELSNQTAQSRDIVFLIEDDLDADVDRARSIARSLRASMTPVSIGWCTNHNRTDTVLPFNAIAEEPEEAVIIVSLNEALRRHPTWQRRRRLIEMGVGRFKIEPPEQKWVAGRVMPAGVPMLLAGRGGIGKTTSAIHLALLIASWDGKKTPPKWMGQEITTAGVTVVISYEEPTDSMHRTLHEMCRAENIDPSVINNLCVIKSMQDRDATGQPLVARNPETRQIDATMEYHELTRELKELQREVGPIACIVIDNLGTAYDVNGNDYQEANQATKWIQRWASEFQALVINIGNTNKCNSSVQKTKPGFMSDEEVLATVMGSTGWTSAHRGVMVMWQMPEAEEAVIAERLKDKDFQPGVTRRRYIHAQVLKENIRDMSTRRMTLKRDGVGLSDVSRDVIGTAARAANQLVDDLVEELKRLAVGGVFLQATGARGVYQNRHQLSAPFDMMTRKEVENVVSRAREQQRLEKGPRGLVVPQKADAEHGDFEAPTAGDIPAEALDATPPGTISRVGCYPGSAHVTLN